jgi:hypothetical protein
MEDHETRRKIIREWMALPKEKRQTEEQVAAFAKKAALAFFRSIGKKGNFTLRWSHTS